MRALFHCSAVELAQLTRRREVSCREVVEAHLARIEEHNVRLGAVTMVLRESALALAEQRDRSREGGPLHGVPFTVRQQPPARSHAEPPRPPLDGRWLE